MIFNCFNIISQISSILYLTNAWRFDELFPESLQIIL